MIRKCNTNEFTFEGHHLIHFKQKQDVFVKYYAPGDNKVRKKYFSLKIKVNVKKSLALVSFERPSLVEYAFQIWNLYLLWFKSRSED